MFTGRYTLPSKGWSQLDIDDTTIADLCRGQPIDTALVGDAGPMRLPKFGYARGFDKVHFIHGHETDHQYYAHDQVAGLRAENYFEDHVMESADAILGEKVVRPLLNQVECHLKERQHWRSDEDQHAAQVMKAASRYLENADRNKSFFLWVDCFDPHEPWDAPSVYDPALKCPYDPDYKGKDMFLPIQGHVEGLYTEPELRHIRMLYAEKVTMVDKWVGWFMDRVRTLGLDENTLVLLVSDHGCPMGNGEHGHGIMRKCRPWPYEELAHIPMISRGPGLPRGTRVSGFVQSCDVAPTVVDWLGIGVHPWMQGKSLLPLAKGEVEALRDFAVAGYFRYAWSIITPEWSFIHWLRDEEKSVADSRFEMYGRELARSTAHPRTVTPRSTCAPTKSTRKRPRSMATTSGPARRQVPARCPRVTGSTTGGWTRSNSGTSQPNMARLPVTCSKDFASTWPNCGRRTAASCCDDVGERVACSRTSRFSRRARSAASSGMPGTAWCSCSDRDVPTARC